MVLSLMMSAKLDILGSLSIKLFWNKVYDVIGLPHDSIKKILSHDLSYIVDMATWQNFSNSMISKKKIIRTTVL